MKHAHSNPEHHDVHVKINAPREAVQVHDDHVVITLHSQMRCLDLSEVRAQLMESMSARDANKLTDELGEFLWRKQLEKMLLDMID